MNRLNGFVIGLLTFMLVGCSTTEVAQISGPTPQDLSRNPDQSLKGQETTWGGEIVSLRNEADRTIVEILAYPLSSSGEPLSDRNSLGRFLADRPGFLEPKEYTAGKRITVTGRLLGYKDGKVGETAYTYPVLEARDISLYQETQPRYYDQKPRVNVGVGVGSYGSGVGIGIGF